MLGGLVVPTASCFADIGNANFPPPPPGRTDKIQGIFGIPLNVSIKYANVAISLTNDNGESFIYGYVPIVVAKCGVFLKEKGMYTLLPFLRSDAGLG